jgi:peptidoglycan/xylan/chitin deacetylase (PgdA/CDA1 family)
MEGKRPSFRALARSAILWTSAALRCHSGARALTSLRGPSLRVMNLHGTPRREAHALEAQLRWARERFQILDPQAFLALLEGQGAPPHRPALVFTFDDGLASNAEIAAPILESLGMRAFFFVNPAFSVTHGEEARRFFTIRIRPVQDPAALASEDFEPMDPNTLRALRRRGHLIGNHTCTHEDLRRVSGTALDAEVRGARQTLSTWLDEPVECFAWTFAWNAITAEAWALALKTHRYCFTACPGMYGHARGCVWRSHTESSLRPHEYPFFYTGLGDVIWWPRRRRLASLHASLQREVA